MLAAGVHKRVDLGIGDRIWKMFPQLPHQHCGTRAVVGILPVADPHRVVEEGEEEDQQRICIGVSFRRA
jgi:hypothetical protein